MRKLWVIAAAVAAVASSEAFPQEQKLASEGRGLLPRPPAATREAPDRGSVLCRCVGRAFADGLRDGRGSELQTHLSRLRFSAGQATASPSPYHLPRSSIVLSGKGEISVAKQRLELTPLARTPPVPAGVPVEVVNSGEYPMVVERSDRGSKIAMLAIVRSISARIFCFLFAVAAAKAAQDDWLTYRHDSARTGAQPFASDLSDPVKISDLQVVAQFPPEASPAIAGGFKASPIVVRRHGLHRRRQRIFLCARCSVRRAQMAVPEGRGPRPARFVRAIRNFAGGCGSYGIPSSATFAIIKGQDAVIFGAPDPTPTPMAGVGSARLFALPLSADPNNPQPIWKSDIVAHVDCSQRKQSS